ncbi:MAG: DegT/DnrJ/EryC1/StrS family aminotransferase [Candidatus Omnitrophica bacterium]|nr:DegT/DnrJ/EryC1/StrS family aminotransferase [Candidatus Omnitrophota bacterium]
MLDIIPRRSVNFSPGVFFTALRIIRDKQVYRGPEIESFKEKFANYIGLKYITGVSLARAGFYLLLKALDLKPGDEIIMPAYNFHVLPIIAKVLGIKPVFVDITSETYNIDVTLIEKNITPKTKAILVIHMSGLPCAMEPILDIAHKNNLKVIEDCAQALGAEYKGRKVGSWGDVSIFSFDFNKNMPCFLGGIVATNDITVYRKLVELFVEYSSFDRRNFWRNLFSNFIFYFAMKKQIFPFTTYPIIRILDSFNSDFVDKLTHSEIYLPTCMPRHYKMRLTNLQAAVGLKQMEALDSVNQRMINNAEVLNRELAGIEGIRIPRSLPGYKHIYLYYRLIVGKPYAFRKKLLRRGVDILRSCMLACSELEFFSDAKANCPVAIKAANNGLEIPNGPSLTEENMLYIARQIRQVNAQLRKR